MIKILFAHNTSDLYGASRSLISIVQSLDPSLATPVVVIPEDGPLKTVLDDLGVEVHVQPSLSIITRSKFNVRGLVPLLAGIPRSALQLRSLIRERGIDVVHTNTAVILSPALAAKWAGVPHIWHIRESFLEFRRLWPLYARFILALSQRVIAISTQVAEQFPRSEKIALVFNGLDTAEFQVDRGALRRDFRARSGLGDEPVIGCVGRIKLVRKGQEVLVKAAALLKQRGIRARYLIVGAPFPGNEAHLVDLQKLVKELGLQDDVVFTGDMEDVRPAYAAMDMLILPSVHPEPFGKVVLEAMAMGLPVIATRQGGPLEAVVEGETGFLVPSADDQALADRIGQLVADEELRRSCGEAGRERVATHFTVPAMMSRIEAIYRKLCPQRPTRRDEPAEGLVATGPRGVSSLQRG